MQTNEQILAIMKRKERATMWATLFVLSPFVILGIVIFVAANS